MGKNYSDMELQQIQSRYKLGLECFIIFVFSTTLSFYIPAGFVYLIVVLSYITTIVIGILLALKVSSVGFGIVMTVLICFPGIGLIPVVFVLIKAAFILKNKNAIPTATLQTSSVGRLPEQTIRRIALYQKYVIFSLCGYILSPFLVFILPQSLFVLIQLASVGFWLACTVFTFMLSKTVYKNGMGVAMGALTLIPIINVIPILKVNDSANTLLQAEGVTVGFFGAKGVVLKPCDGD